MSSQSEVPSQKSAPVGGVVVEWILSQPVRSFVSKSDGTTKTVVELRDPARLGNSITVFVDGDAGTLAAVATHTTVRIRLDEVRAGRSRGELVGSVERAALDAAFGGGK